MKKTNEILILGSIGLDTIETQYGKRENLLGGSATYATIASGIFSSVVPVGIVGDDFPKEGYDIFSRFSKNINNIKIEEGKTFQWGGKYHKNGDDRDTLLQTLVYLKILTPLLMKKMRMLLGSF